jgi:O-antigen ligase
MSDADSILVDAVPRTSRGWPSAAPSAQPTTSTIDREWDLLLVCTVVYVLTVVGRLHELFPPLNVVRPAITAGLLSILLFLTDRLAVRRWSWLSGGPTPWLLALFGWMILSIPSALIPGNSFDYVSGEMSKTVLMAFVVAGAIRGPRDLERIVGALFYAIALYSAVVLLRFDLGEGSQWRLGKLYYYDANDFATVAVAVMPLGVLLAKGARSLWGRGLPIIGLILISAVFVRSGSRGGFLALIVTSLFFILSFRAISFMGRLAAIAAVALVILAAGSERYWTQIGSTFSEADYNQTDESGRLQVWQRGIGYVMSNPLFGVGTSNFSAAEGQLSELASRQQYGVGVKWNAPHNSFLQVTAENGIPALVFFLGMLASIFRVLKPAPGRGRVRRSPIPPALKQALRASLLGFIIGAFFLSLAYTQLLYVVVAVAIGIHKLERLAVPAAKAS